MWVLLACPKLRVVGQFCNDNNVTDGCFLL